MSADRSLHWKEIFIQAVNESGREKLHRLVREAEVAIFLRREELGDFAEDREELSESTNLVRRSPRNRMTTGHL
jgi:hypothetical protein